MKQKAKISLRQNNKFWPAIVCWCTLHNFTSDPAWNYSGDQNIERKKLSWQSLSHSNYCSLGALKENFETILENNTFELEYITQSKICEYRSTPWSLPCKYSLSLCSFCWWKMREGCSTIKLTMWVQDCKRERFTWLWSIFHQLYNRRNWLQTDLLEVYWTEAKKNATIGLSCSETIIAFLSSEIWEDILVVIWVLPCQASKVSVCSLNKLTIHQDLRYSWSWLHSLLLNKKNNLQFCWTSNTQAIISSWGFAILASHPYITFGR